MIAALSSPQGVRVTNDAQDGRVLCKLWCAVSIGKVMKMA